jgi:hypothetical protein
VQRARGLIETTAAPAATRCSTAAISLRLLASLAGTQNFVTGVGPHQSWVTRQK